MSRLDGRTAVVTGGGTGIGHALVLALAAEGARVFVAGRDGTRGNAVVQEVISQGGWAQFVRTDVTIDDQVARLAQTAAADGPFDFWVSNAGIEGPVGPVMTWTEDALRQVLDTNLKGVLSGLKHGSQYMKSGGSIVNIGSFVGTALPVPIAVPYAATKAGVVAAGRSAAPLLAEAAIDVFTLCPWVVDTPMVDRLTGGADDDKSAFAAGFAPSGHLTTAQDVAGVTMDLLDGRLPATSGDAYLVDAGATITKLAL